jgi:hypothetical protein
MISLKGNVSISKSDFKRNDFMLGDVGHRQDIIEEDCVYENLSPQPSLVLYLTRQERNS